MIFERKENRNTRKKNPRSTGEINYGNSTHMKRKSRPSPRFPWLKELIARYSHCAFLFMQVDLKCPWWMTYLQDIVDSKNPGDHIVSERLIDKIKSDLNAARNVQEHGSLSMADRYDFRSVQHDRTNINYGKD